MAVAVASIVSGTHSHFKLARSLAVRLCVSRPHAPRPLASRARAVSTMGDEWPTAAAEYQIIEQIGQVRT